jgi:A/G-specific adenine glycosylase
VAGSSPASSSPLADSTGERDGYQRDHTLIADSNRWVRGRVVAALAAGEGMPRGIAPDRLQPALQGLLRDGLIGRVAGGYALG